NAYAYFYRQVSYWRQFEQGMLVEESVQALSSVVESAEDIPFYVVHAKDIKKYLIIRGFFPWIYKKLSAVYRVCLKEDVISPPPNSACDNCLFHIKDSVF